MYRLPFRGQMLRQLRRLQRKLYKKMIRRGSLRSRELQFFW